MAPSTQEGLVSEEEFFIRSRVSFFSFLGFPPQGSLFPPLEQDVDDWIAQDDLDEGDHVDPQIPDGLWIGGVTLPLE